MLISTNNAALEILMKVEFSLDDVEIIFGSDFPLDNTEIQICHNIQKIKNCMENGKRVILLYLEHLYESLYDLYVLDSVFISLDSTNITRCSETTCTVALP